GPRCPTGRLASSKRTSNASTPTHESRRTGMSKGVASAEESTDVLSREAIAAVDPSDQLGDVLALPGHLRDALWRVESAIMEDSDTSAGLVVAGMGGSAIGGALARAALSD